MSWSSISEKLFMALSGLLGSSVSLWARLIMAAMSEAQASIFLKLSVPWWPRNSQVPLLSKGMRLSFEYFPLRATAWRRLMSSWMASQSAAS